VSFDDGLAHAVEWVVFERADARLREAIGPDRLRPDYETERQDDLGLSMASRYAGREAKAACVRAVKLPNRAE
jgi:hypothetical protein